MRWLLIGAVALLAGCASTHKTDAPESWEKPVSPPSQGCVELSGTYYNTGESSDSRKHYLSQFFKYFIPQSTLLKHQWVDSVTLSSEQKGKLAITFNSKGKAAYQLIWLQGKDFTCQAQYIRKEISYMPSNPYALAHHTSITLLTPAKDGALLVSDIDKETGVALMVLPYQESKHHFYRYRRVKQP